MEYAQKFIPEGWEECTKSFSLDELNKLSVSGEILQAKVTKCDSNYNLYLDLGNLFRLYLQPLPLLLV